ncbi:MAG: hypothetical protein HC923_04750 [Myxococcales bacterium]|nr:hypothetical protein [Myxococcales bacterium]
MRPRSRILLQTTIPFVEDDWHIGRFRLLHEHLASLVTPDGDRAFEVVSRDREPIEGVDPVLRDANTSDFDQIWVFGVDGGAESGLSEPELAGLDRYYRSGGSLLLTRDHHDMGCNLSKVGDVGAVHCWQTVTPEEDLSRQTQDDDNASIGWPNYHSGKNGAFQRIEPIHPNHPLLEGVALLPAHPHEGALRTPTSESGHAVARGKSRLSGRDFVLVVAFDHPARDGVPARRAAAHSSFHHFADYNIDVSVARRASLPTQ